MFDFSSFYRIRLFITEDHHVYTYADLLGLSERFSEHLVPRSLIFIGCENSLSQLWLMSRVCDRGSSFAAESGCSG